MVNYSEIELPSFKKERKKQVGMRYRQLLEMKSLSNGITLPVLLHTTVIIGKLRKQIMERIQENEQRKLEGNCRKCRRAKYCSKPCTRCRRTDQAEIACYIAEALNEITGGSYGKIMENRMY